MRRRHIRSHNCSQNHNSHESGLLTALRALRDNPDARIVNPFILAELRRLDFIRHAPWATVITLKGEAFLSDLTFASLQRPGGSVARHAH